MKTHHTYNLSHIVDLQVKIQTVLVLVLVTSKVRCSLEMSQLRMV